MMTSQVRLSEITGGGYDGFWSCEKRYRVLKGGKGSKKSATTALNFIFRLMKLENSNLLVVRQVMNTHRDSTFAQLKWAQERLGVAHLWKNTVSPMEMTYLPTGQKILFRGFDDVLKLASTTVSAGYLNFVWIEEAFEISSEADFDKLDLSVPRGTVEPPLYKQTTLTFNPWSGTHWLKKRFFDRPDDRTAVFSTNYLINEFLDAADRAVFERMKKENPRKYEVAGLGNWGISEGLVYENWTVGKKEIPESATSGRTFSDLITATQTTLPALWDLRPIRLTESCIFTASSAKSVCLTVTSPKQSENSASRRSVSGLTARSRSQTKTFGVWE